MVSFCARDLTDVSWVYLRTDVNCMLLPAALPGPSLFRSYQTVEKHPKTGHPNPLPLTGVHF